MDGRHEDRALSPVIGTVLLVGMFVMVMAVLASQILGVGFLDRQPQVELVYEERSSDELIIGVEDATALSAGDTRLRLESGTECRAWPGSGKIEPGETVQIDTSHCSFSENDVIQVIGSSSLLDTYQIRGVGVDVDFTCSDIGDPDMGNIDNSDVVINTGKTVKCDFTDSDEERNFKVSNNSELIGDIATEKGKFTLNTAAFNGDVSTVEGSFDLDHGSVDGDLSTESGDFTLDSTTVNGDIEVNGSGEATDVTDGDIQGSILGNGDVTIDGETTVEGAVFANGNLGVDGGTTIDGPVFVTGNVVLNNQADRINGTVYVTDKGNIDDSSSEQDVDVDESAEDVGDLRDKFEDHR